MQQRTAIPPSLESDGPLAEVLWEQLPTPLITGGTVPYATAAGVLKILDLEITVYQLSNGQRVFPEPELEKFWDWLEK